MTTIELRDALKLNGIDSTTGKHTQLGDYANPQVNDQRTAVRGIKKVDQRFVGIGEPGADAEGYVDIFSSGGSIETDSSLTLNKTTKADVIVNDEGEIRNLVRSATFSDGTVVGDRFGTTFVVCNGNQVKAQPAGPEAWRIVQAVATIDSTGTEFSVDYTTPIDSDGSTGNKFKVIGVALPAGVTVQAKVFKQSDLADSVWQNVSDAEFANGEGATLDETTGIITSNANLFAPGGEALHYVIIFSAEVTLKGSNALGTAIYGEVLATPIGFNAISTNDQQMSVALSTDMTLDGTEQTIAVDTVVDSDGLTLPFDGILQCNSDGYYRGELALYIEESGNPTLFFWVDLRITSSDPWVPVNSSMISRYFKDDTSDTIHLGGGFNLDSGNQIRARIKKSGGLATLTAQAEALAGTTLTQPSAMINLYKAGNKKT